MDNIEILYEDNHLLVINKPPNMPSQPDASQDADALTILKSYIKEKYNKPGNVYLGLLHRLDRPVSGIMAFAKTSKAAARISQQIRENDFKKEYSAVVTSLLNKNAVLKDYLLKDKRTNMVRVVQSNTHLAQYSELSYELIDTCASKEYGSLFLLNINLKTGRSHQIRVQLSNAGIPIWGDARYGGGQPGQQIALCATKLEFYHPTNKNKLTFTIQLPNRMPFELFTKI